MNEKELRAAVERLVLCELAKTGQRYVPVMSSNTMCICVRRMWRSSSARDIS